MEYDETNTLEQEVPETPILESETPETPVIEAEDGPIDLDAPEEPSIEDEPEDAEVEPEAPSSIDFELEPGKVIKVDPELQPYLLRDRDYRQKTQAVAEMRKDVEAKAAQIEQMATVSNEEIQARAALVNITTELEAYANVNWQQWMNEDPIEAQSQYMRFQQLEKAKGQTEHYQTELMQQRSQITEQNTVNRLKATAEFAQKEIKGWTPDLDAKITQFALGQGFTVDTLKAAYNPQVYSILYKAYIGEQTLSRQSAAKPTAPMLQPTKTVSGKAAPSVTKDPEEMNMAEYANYRQQQMRKR